MKKINREQIKKIVYNYVKKQFWNPDEFDNIIIKKHDNGEDVLIYDELEFDSLDVTELIVNLENEFREQNFIFDENLFTKDITLGNIIDYIYNNQH